MPIIENAAHAAAIRSIEKGLAILMAEELPVIFYTELPDCTVTQGNFSTKIFWDLVDSIIQDRPELIPDWIQDLTGLVSYLIDEADDYLCFYEKTSIYIPKMLFKNNVAEGPCKLLWFRGLERRIVPNDSPLRIGYIQDGCLFIDCAGEHPDADCADEELLNTYFVKVEDKYFPNPHLGWAQINCIGLAAFQQDGRFVIKPVEENE